MKKEIWIKGLSVLIVLIVLAVISGIGTGIPIKRGLSIEEARERLENSNTYICEQIATTGPGWLIYKEEEEKQGVILEGKLPIDEINKNSFFYSAHNKFLIIGEKIGVKAVLTTCQTIDADHMNKFGVGARLLQRLFFDYAVQVLKCVGAFLM